MIKKKGYVYFMTNYNNNVLYVGVTSNLLRRVFEHKAKEVEGFTKKYNCNKLVYFEEYDLVIDAIEREKQIKAGSRKKKNELVQVENPDWTDLYLEL